MKRRITLFSTAVLLLGLLWSFTMHDFYTSITKIEHNLGTKSLKFSTKIATENLETVMSKKANAADFNGNLATYLSNNVKVIVNGQNVNINFSGYNLDGDVVWIYYEVVNINEVKSISVKNTLLFDKFPTQQNFVNIMMNGQKKSFVCKKTDDTGEVNF